MKEKSQLGFIKYFRLVGILEGISYLVLLGIAMPLKYYAGIPEAVKMIGWAHGLLFVLYIAAAVQAKFKLNWSIKQLFMACVASVLPFGPFVIDKQLQKQAQIA